MQPTQDTPGAPGSGDQGGLYHWILRRYYDELYANKFDNWDEMDTILEKHKL